VSASDKQGASNSVETVCALNIGLHLTIILEGKQIHVTNDATCPNYFTQNAWIASGWLKEGTS